MSDSGIFKAAVKLPPEQRPEFIDKACGTNHELRLEVESLLRAHDQAGSFLQSQPAPPHSTVDEPLITEQPGTVIGPYKLLEQIGEGGFGLVFMAEQRQPLRRKVAFKIIKPGMDTRMVVARFEAERQALALMDHPNIAGVFDGGETAAGRPFFVMELVRGLPITEYCDQNQLTPRERLALFLDVCKAVQHAHHKGIIHRDIKPTNILITVHDTRPVVKVIDFGIAKAIGQQLTEKTLFTNFAQMVGTPLYMSPEQVGLSGLDVDTRSDVYSLGVLLYELLTGRTPFDKKRIREADYDEIRRIIREEEPPRPSTRVSTMGMAASTVAAQRKSDPKRLSQLIRGELDWIVMKALEKDRTRRYETASAFAADVERYLHDEPVQACPPSAAYRLRKFARRNKGKLAVAACLLLAIMVSAGGVGWKLQERAGLAARTTAGVDLALEEFVQKKDKQVQEALAAVHKAEVLLAGGLGSDELHQRVRAARATVEERLKALQADGQMAAELSEIRLGTTEDKDDHYDNLRADDDYAAAFQKYGIDVDRLDVAEAARRIREREIALDLVAALDHWVTVRRLRLPKEPGWKHLLAVAKMADPEGFRNQVREALKEGDQQALAQLAADTKVMALSPSTLVLIGNALLYSDAVPEAVVFFEKAQREHVDDFWINHQLARSLTRLQPAKDDKAIVYFMAALALHKSPGVYVNLGHPLLTTGAVDEAIHSYKQAIRLKPDYAVAHVGLGNALMAKKLLDEAIVEHREAIRLKPDYAHAHLSLARALVVKGLQDEAIGEFKAAIRIKPDDHAAHYSLGHALMAKGLQDEAIGEFKEAIRIKPDDHLGHYNLGHTLMGKGLQDEAIAAYREAIRLKPDYHMAHGNLASIFYAKGLVDEAIAALKETIRIKPDDPLGHYNLGNALVAKRLADEAVLSFKEAIRLKPDFAEAHCNLGGALQRQGRFAEALAAFRRGHELGSKNPKWPYPSAAWIKECEHCVEVDGKLADVLKGENLPSTGTGWIELAWHCLHNKHMPQTGLGFYEKAFAAQPDFEKNANLVHRYNAACAAALAGSGKGAEAGKLDDMERAGLRMKALAWLQADLEHWLQQFDAIPDKSRAAVLKKMQMWQGDADFNGVRGAALAGLPEAERQAWQQLWDDAAALRGRAAKKD